MAKTSLQEAPRVIAIDGPSAAGKGTIAAMLAKRLGWEYLDSGAYYRAFAWFVSLQKDNLDTELDPSSLEACIAAFLQAQLEFEQTESGVRVRCDAIDISRAIREEKVSILSSGLATHKSVRSCINKRLKEKAESTNLVVDGRDMTSVVFPDAFLKILLTADEQVRAERRLKQLQAAGFSVTLAQILQDLQSRDTLDTNRLEGPLMVSEGVLVIDNSLLSVEDTVECIFNLYEDKLAKLA